jgi:Carboxypeptidase regulatory-like domain
MSAFRSGWASTLTLLASLIVCAARAPQNSPGDPTTDQFRIAGTVVNRLGGAPLGRTRVTIRNVKDAKDLQSQLTGDDGRFEFRVKAGKYALHGAKRGFISSDYNQHDQYSSAIVTGAGIDTQNLRLQLAASAALTGRILDESGDPVRGASVTLWRDDHTTGVSRIAQFRQEVTDDLGAYEFTPLDVGTYFLSVSATPWYAVHPATTSPEGASVAPAVVDRSLDVVYPTTYYAGATESEDATPIPLRGGDRVELDLRLAPVPALHIIFRSQQDPDKGYAMPRLQKRVFDSFDQPRGQENIQTISPGVFELTAAPGKYTVRLWGAAQNSRISDVDILQDRQEIDASSGEALSNITASVHVLGEETVPRELFVILREAQRRGGVFGEMSNNGEVQFQNVSPGTYSLMAGSQNDAYAVVKIASEGHEIPGHTLKVPAGATMSLSLTLASGSGRVEGIAKRDGKGIAGAMVVLVPKHSDANLELFRRDQSDLDGTFVLQGVVPGAYTVIAIADGWDLDWSRPGVLAKYVGHGQTIVVPGQKGRSLQLPEPVEVQGK